MLVNEPSGFVFFVSRLLPSYSKRVVSVSIVPSLLVLVVGLCELVAIGVIGVVGNPAQSVGLLS